MEADMDKRIYIETKNIREKMWELETLTKILNELTINRPMGINQDDIIVLTDIISTKSKILSKIFNRHFSDVETATFNDCIS